MRIVLPVHHFPPRYSAGAELYTYRLARWLQKHGHEVEVIAIEDIDRGSTTQIDARLDRYDDIPVWRLSFNLMAAPQRRRWEFDNELLGAWFETYFQRQRPDLVHFQAGYLIGVAPIFAAANQHVPTLLTLHDYWFLCPQHTLQRSNGELCVTVPGDPAVCARCRMWGNDPYVRIGRRLPLSLRTLAEKLPLDADTALMTLRRERLQAALSTIRAVIAPSRYMYGRFDQMVAPGRLVFSRYGFDGEHLIKDLARGTRETMRFGYIGQIAPHKGVHVLVDAFRRLHTSYYQAVELHIWGGLDVQPSYSQSLKRAADADSRIKLQGRFDRIRLPEVLGSFDYSVIPSIWFENSPFSILESHSAGIPVITSDLGGMAELVDVGQNGLVFRPGDAIDLARIMQSVLDNAELNVRLQSGARQRFVRDTDDEMQQLTRLYEVAHKGFSD